MQLRLNGPKKTIIVLWMVISSLILSGAAVAGTYYVSPSGKASWNQATNITTPTSPTIAMANAVAGDIVYFRGGTYNVGPGPSNSYIGALNPSNSGTPGNPITFMAYPGETPVMNGEARPMYAYARVFGTDYQSYIVYDGFTITADGGTNSGSIVVSGKGGPYSVGCVVRNCIIDGGSVVRVADMNDNCEGLRIEDTQDTLIENCRIFNFRVVDNNHNTSATKHYHNINLTIQNCEISGSSVGIYDKSNGRGITIRNNWIHDNNIGFFYEDSGLDSYNFNIYNNLFSKNNTSIDACANSKVSDNWSVYNNTIYQSSTNQLGGVRLGIGANRRLWNNVIVGNFNNNGGAISLKSTTSAACDLTYSDYNIYGAAEKTYNNHWYNEWNSGGSIQYERMSTISAWTGSNASNLPGNFGGNSKVVSVGALFANSSGTLTTLSDFTINTAATGSGKDGKIIGADTSQVGTQGIGFNLPAPPVSTIESPKNLRVTSNVNN